MPSERRDNSGKPKKRKYIPHGKTVRKGAYPLRPGVQGFFVTCDGGRERQASTEVMGLLEDFYEELVDGRDSSGSKADSVVSKPMNKVIKFDSDSDSDGSDKEGQKDDETQDSAAKKQRTETAPPECETSNKTIDNPIDELIQNELKETRDMNKNEVQKEESLDLAAKKECTNTDPPEREAANKMVDKPIDELIQNELREVRDRNKRHFVNLDSGCNGLIFIQMHKRPGSPSPTCMLEHMLTKAASTRKHMSRFILRILPAEVTCYASEEEISKAIKPLLLEHFPALAQIPQKFAVLFEARANTGIDRMTIINAVAKLVPEPHKVDLSNPDKTIIVEVAKTVCSIGVAKRYKELLKYNLRQLTLPVVQ